MQGREVKFGQMLETLIERRGYSRNRKKILRSLDISAAALSQYVRERQGSCTSPTVKLSFVDLKANYPDTLTVTEPAAFWK